MNHEEAVQARFSETAAKLAAFREGDVEALTARLRRFVAPTGDERAVDVGTGTGVLAFALAPLVREVVGVDVVPEMLEQARRRAGGIENVAFVDGDIYALPFGAAGFDLVVTSRTVHHIRRPELALAELTRVAKPGGRLLVVDALASVDPLAAAAHNRIECLRDPSHVRVLSDQDFRGLFDANSLVLRRFEVEREERDFDEFLDLAGCEGEARQVVVDEVEKLLARGERAGIDLRRTPTGYAFTVSVGWYLLEKPAA